MSDETRKFFGLSTTGFFAKCTHIQPQLLDIKNVPNMQRVNLKFEVEMTPEKLLGSHYFDSAFEKLPSSDSTQKTLEGTEEHPSTGNYRARPGGEIKRGQDWVDEKDWAIELKAADNPDELYGHLASVIHLLDPAKDEIPNAIRLHPLSGIALNSIKLDEDKHTGTPRATFVFMVKGLPSEVAGVEWLLHGLRFEVVEKNEEEVNIENAHERAKKTAKGQGTIQHETGTPVTLTDEQTAAHKQNVEALIDVVDQTAWIRLEEQCGDGCTITEGDVETVFQNGIAKHGPLDLELIASEHSPAHFTKAAQASTTQSHRFCYLMLALYLDLTGDKEATA